MKLLIVTNIPAPYRLDFFNELGKYCDLTVLFEAERNYALNKAWYTDKITNFKAEFLKRGAIEEKKVNPAIFKFLKNNKFDKIILTNYSYFTELAGLIYLKLKRIPYYMELDGSYIKNENFLVHSVKKFLIGGAVGYMSSSRQTDEFLMQYGVAKEKIHRYPFTSLWEKDIIKNNISYEEKKEIKKSLEIPYEKMVVSVGRFIQGKGFDILLNAWKNIPENTGLYIVGGIPTEEYLKIIEENNLKNIHFVDFQTGDTLNKYYLAADLFVLPTRKDIWGLVINEAMAHGLPVITTDTCAAGVELIDERCGSIIPSENVEALNKDMIKIISDDELRSKMSENALLKIKEYTIENMVKVHIKEL